MGRPRSTSTWSSARRHRGGSVPAVRCVLDEKRCLRCRVVLRGRMGKLELPVILTVEPEGRGSRFTRRVEMERRLSSRISSAYSRPVDHRKHGLPIGRSCVWGGRPPREGLTLQGYDAVRLVSRSRSGVTRSETSSEDRLRTVFRTRSSSCAGAATDADRRHATWPSGRTRTAPLSPTP